MARRSDHSREEIKEMALIAAEKMILEKGLSGLSARKVAQAIGYTVGTLYLIFKNLDDLILHVNARTLDRLYQKMTADKPLPSDSQNALLQLAQTYISFADEESQRWKIVFEHHSEEEHTPNWYMERVTRMFTQVEKHLQALAPHKSAVEIKNAARAIWGGVHGICILAITGNLGVAGVESVDDLTQSLISNYLKGFTSN
ncbi:MAG: TetR/AcrR family transcriptional regulator [gamma proteobacterium symbiont of Taylorina sp.]|nr:TetR/AcrR family transcriptional regulator [gamma proteobacterium symbiont of Taylorina sp.]